MSRFRWRCSWSMRSTTALKGLPFKSPPSLASLPPIVQLAPSGCISIVHSELKASQASEAWGLLESISFSTPAGVGLRGLFGVGALDDFPVSGIGDNEFQGTLLAARRDGPIFSSAIPIESSDSIFMSSSIC
jgi:hypothetical protein